MLFATAVIVRAVKLRQIVAIALCAVPIVLAVSLMAHGSALIPISGASSDAERMRSLMDGLHIFIAHPLFGAGLGYYFREAVTAGNALVIHSTPVWLLAETGIIGLTVALGTAGLMLRAAWQPKLPAQKLLLLVLAVFVVMSSVHELLYQRAWWFLAGAALAAIASKCEDVPDYVRAETQLARS